MIHGKKKRIVRNMEVGSFSPAGGIKPITELLRGSADIMRRRWPYDSHIWPFQIIYINQAMAVMSLSDI